MSENTRHRELTADDLDKVVGGARTREASQPLEEATGSGAEPRRGFLAGTTKDGEAPEHTPPMSPTRPAG